MQFERPGRARDRALALGAGHDVLVVQGGDAPDLPGLADADLHAGVVDERLLASYQPVLEEFCVFANLLAALYLRFRDILDQHRIELSAITADDARAVAEQLVRTRRREQENLRTRQIVFPAVVQAS